ncbi:beta-N-acetylhexosaminidase [Caulobacter sp. S45]|uniref:beta-N-acetylhexosaminidase n=1 Tax=Caulobacter sp. S45 TaxID=1641861 RepID=UPI00157549A8|nr:beta-N-acetylhexosaminidase [Caulobacter sp. S45]
MTAACILGCAGQLVTAEERAFFRDVKPWGFILFARNIVDADQVRRLNDSLREAADDANALIFIDQEGGRVQRLKPPLARLRRPAALFGQLYGRDPEQAVEAVTLNHRLLAHELLSLGIDADCAPCMDLLHPKGHGVVGDRAFGADVAQVAALGRAAVDGLLAGGVVPVIKHIPGHGRAELDSHHAMPVVSTSLAELEETDFQPFRALADAAMAMTAHVTYRAVDPQDCVTLSHRAISTVIRGHIGFDGLLMSDDLSMRALGGSLAERTRRTMQAGCDVALHGNGALVGEPVRDLMAELRAVADHCGDLAGRAAERAADARAPARRSKPFDPNAAEARLDELGLAGHEAAASQDIFARAGLA